MIAIRLLVTAAALTAAALLAPSCSEGPQQCEWPADCEDVEELPVGTVWECVDSACQPVECKSRSDCLIETFCDVPPPTEEEPNPEGVCVEGCRHDDDCYAGDYCSAGVCEHRACRSSQLDCNFGEFCQAGECVPAGPPYCSPCDPSQVVYTDPFSCDRTVVSHPTCGAGNFCWSFETNQSCGVACTHNHDCPAGFTCGAALFQDPSCGDEPEDLVNVGTFCLAQSCDQ